MYDFEVGSVRDFLKRTGAKKAAVQLPAGLGKYLPEIERVFAEFGVEMILVGQGCYGACDIADEVAKKLGCDVLIHYGHADMGLKSGLPTLFIEARAKKGPQEAVKLYIPEIKFKRVGLVATVQYIGYLDEVAKILNTHGIQTLVGEQGKRSKYPGQILGCDVGCAKAISSVVDGFVYIGTGEFHPIGVALATGKQVFAINPMSNGFKIFTPNQKEFLGRRKAMIAKAALANNFGVIVGTKVGQVRLNLAKKLTGLLKASGREAHLLAVDELTPEKIGNFGFDAFVCTTCPRIPIDDADRFDKPMLTPFEVEVMLGKSPIEPYKVDEVYPEDMG